MCDASFDPCRLRFNISQRALRPLPLCDLKNRKMIAITTSKKPGRMASASAFCKNVCLCAILALGAAIIIIMASGVRLVGFDDANITFVYARNLAQGIGFEYTPGGGRVEGCTSLLWTVLLASFFRWAAHPEPIIFA